MGSSIFYNPKFRNEGKNEHNMGIVKLAHEFKHSFDLANGIFRTSRAKFIEPNVGHRSIPLYEIDAVSFENIIRKQISGMNLRTTYPVNGKDVHIPASLLK